MAGRDGQARKKEIYVKLDNKLKKKFYCPQINEHKFFFSVALAKFQVLTRMNRNMWLVFIGLDSTEIAHFITVESSIGQI